MSRKKTEKKIVRRRRYSQAFKEEAVQMLLDGHPAATVAENLGITHVNMLYRWKRQAIEAGGMAANELDAQTQRLRDELHRTQRERDILKKALSILSQRE